MKTVLKYIELKTGFSHNGPAWIGLVSLSKSGKTLYFDGKAFQSLQGNGLSGNYYELESGDEYWISGVKKNQHNRHRSGGGSIYLENRSIEEYLKCIDLPNLDLNQYILIDVEEILPLDRIHRIENAIECKDINQINFKKITLQPSAMTLQELNYFIEYYQEDSIRGRFLNGRKYARKQMNLLLLEKERRLG